MFKTISAAALILLLVSCGSSGGGGATLPGSTPALSIVVAPNPIVAHQVSGNTYDFPFQISLRNSSRAALNIERVSINVMAVGGISIYSQSYGPEDIQKNGYPTTIPAGQELSYQFNPRKEVPDPRLFGGVSATLTATGRDPQGVEATASTEVTVTKS